MRVVRKVSLTEIFEKVNLIMPIEQRRFFNYFNDTITEISAKYSKFVFQKDTDYQPPKSLNDECPVLPLYTAAIVDNIIFLAGGDENRKNEFLRKAHDTYLKYWNDNAKGRKVEMTRRW